jgi:SAM-dependent methyltransferase
VAATARLSRAENAMPIAKLRSLLDHPLTKGLDLDDPKTTELRVRIIREKVFLRRIYDEWYRTICAAIPAGEGAVLELGSGAGYFQEFVPEAIQSEVFACSNAHLVADARSLPFRDGSLKAIAMTNVLHHIPDIEQFLREAARCLRKGGRILMVEPWVSGWSRLIYTTLHHEPFVPEAGEWKIPDSGPLSSANGALPWMVFERDRARFEKEFAEFRIVEIRPWNPFRYLVSGGVSMKTLVPTGSYGAWEALEGLLEPWMGKLAMFAFLAVERS